MKLKKRAIPMLAGVLTAVMLTSTASAHPEDYWGGKYIGHEDAKFTLRISRSAQTDFLNSDIYWSARDWNGISSNVRVNVSFVINGRTTIDDGINVYGDNLGKYLLGYTTPYDSNGKPLDTSIDGLISDWAYASITMNTNSSAFSGASDPKLAAQMTFVHEVGHVLKLTHPFISRGLGGHTIDGKPVAIMNQGLPGDFGGAVSSTITGHDKSCLKAKWGA